MSQTIPLIQKSDAYELLRDKLASILAIEGAAQVVLAEAVPIDPTPWVYYTYIERVNPWENFRDGAGDLTPIVNVWFDSTSFDKSSSNVSTRQKTDPTRFNIDVYTYAKAAETPTGHDPGDKAAAVLCHHVLKLVRNILMHDKYKYLDMQGVVWRRWVGQMTAFQPQSGGQPLNRVMACRLVLEVEHLETIDLEDHETCSIIGIDMRHEVDGQVIAEVEIDFGDV